MYGFSKYDAQDRYDSYNTVQVKLKLNMKTDADILAWVRQPKYGRDTSVQGAIKAILKQYWTASAIKCQHLYGSIFLFQILSTLLRVLTSKEN